MKKKFITLIFLPILMLAACEKDLTDINVDPKNPLTAPSYAFYSNAQVNLMDELTSTNVNENIFRLIMQYWQETTYTDESNYDLITRQIPRQMWNYLYRDVLRDIQESKKLIPQQVTDAGLQQNQLAIAEITEIVTWYYLVTSFGDIPYSQALDPQKILPKYDNQHDIYNDLLTRLDAAIGKLNPDHGSFGNADLLYGGDVSLWKKFANSFKLKMGMTLADVDPAKAKATVESAVAAGVISSNAENTDIVYTSAPPNTNPVWDDLVQSNRKDFVAASTVVDRMNALKDPRLNEYFQAQPGGIYIGGTPGASSPWAQFSKPGTVFYRPDNNALLIDYSEVEFFLAEAKERGYNVPGTAQEHYNNAVTASITYWGNTAADATAYLAQPGVAYNSANWKQLIGEQKWLALYNRGWESWIEWRRLDYPIIKAPASAVSDVPLRFTYPIPEQNVNTTNYNAAVSKIPGGKDVVGVKLFWDVL
ncbi:SusD/RagB family nutrient-binding outer membrane lipoprotein [Flavisolibacter tropicus]|uniref:SusD/RagB family nutrient-binding outer membrane lipoprotein n=1 Tax=Flavisolibacter tropicus TaxID=1492898 RepID=A0A172TQJ1_9BACT|nr:SusD/RagB family nutrient-binding outer membrane lipoprotein [Flavisolibacter tropicus]ANE49300.1 hypothetical protein SY85_01080 [Flavisolibacter tropicus]